VLLATWIMVVIGGFLVVGGAATDRRALTAAGSAVALVAGVIAMTIRRPPRPWAWRSLLLGSAVTVFILVALARTEGALNLTGRVADIVVVVFYATVAAGLILVGGRAAGRDLADTLDAAIVALGVFLLMWLFLLGGRFTPTDQAFAPGYVRPIALAALTGILTRLVFVVDRRTPSFRLLVAATICALVNGVLTMGRLAGYRVNARIDTSGVWFASYAVLLAGALLHPSSTFGLSTRQSGQRSLSATRAAVFTAMTLLGPLAWVVAIVSSRFHPASVRDFGTPVMIAALIALLLLWRLGLITRLADARADQLEALEAELVHRATHDPLTGLGNRAELTDKLDILVGHRDERSGRPALLLVDLDGFKAINDAFGHPVGDEVLIGVAKRLTTLCPPDSTVARPGGDEFVILLADADARSALTLADRVRKQLIQPHPTSRGPQTIGASVGVCAIPRVDQSSSEFLRDADKAL
jgi:diguanylate cyclase (GGDEF)-like protein